MKTRMGLRGRYDVEVIGLDGKVRARRVAYNDLTVVGVNELLDVMFGGSAQTDPWLILFIDDSGFAGLANTDTMASHAGWTENTDYDEATREIWDEDAAANEQMTNSTPAAFTMNAGVTIRGMGLTSVNTKGGATGILFSTAEFDGGALAVLANEILRVTYTLTR